MNYFPRGATKTTRRRIPAWVREDFEWWNRLLPTYNGVLFCDGTNREAVNLYTDAYLYGLGGFKFKGSGAWTKNKIEQGNSFQALISGKGLPANRKAPKDPEDLSINVHEVEEILLAFQTWGSIWHRHNIHVYTDSSTAYAGLADSTLKRPANAPLREIFLLAAKWDNSIEPHWVEGGKPG